MDEMRARTFIHGYSRPYYAGNAERRQAVRNIRRYGDGLADYWRHAVKTWKSYGKRESLRLARREMRMKDARLDE